MPEKSTEDTAAGTSPAAQVPAKFAKAYQAALQGSALPGESDDLVTIEDSAALKRLRRVMSDHVGVIRTREGLKAAIREIATLERENSRMRFHNIVTTAKLIAAGAYLREESRGGHFRSDFPEQKAIWKHRTFLTLADADTVVAELAETAAA